MAIRGLFISSSLLKRVIVFKYKVERKDREFPRCLDCNKRREIEWDELSVSL